MELFRLVLVAVGLAALLAALVLSVPEAPLAELVSAVGSDYLLVAAVAVVGLVVAAGRLHWGRSSGIEQAAMPEPERPVWVKPLGADFDRALENRRLLVPVFGDAARQRVHDELRATAARTVCRVGHCDHETAVDHLARCDWTDDVAAAAFLEGGTPPKPTLSTELTSLLRGKPWFRAQATNAAQAIVDIATAGEAPFEHGLRDGPAVGGMRR